MLLCAEFPQLAVKPGQKPYDMASLASVSPSAWNETHKVLCRGPGRSPGQIPCLTSVGPSTPTAHTLRGRLAWALPRRWPHSLEAINSPKWTGRLYPASQVLPMGRAGLPRTAASLYFPTFCALMFRGQLTKSRPSNGGPRPGPSLPC